MPECADCGSQLELQDAGPLFWCPGCEDEIGVEERDRIVEGGSEQAVCAPTGGVGNDTIECHSPCTGRGIYVPEYDVYACPWCGSIQYSDQVSTTSRGKPLLGGGAEDEFVRVVGTVSLDDVAVGPMAVVKAPYGAKENIKELSFRRTERRWSDEVGHWVVHDRYRAELTDHMKDEGWDVIDLVKLRDVSDNDI